MEAPEVWQGMTPRVWTVGHSTRSFEQFVDLLLEHDLEAVADVRRYPGSRRYPHFAREALFEGLAMRHVSYEWFPELGGRRRGAGSARRLGLRAQHRGDVRGGAVVAVSPRADCRCAALGEFRGVPHRGARLVNHSSLHRGGSGQGRAAHLCGTGVGLSSTRSGEPEDTRCEIPRRRRLRLKSAPSESSEGPAAYDWRLR